jgi:hypothetical protein
MAGPREMSNGSTLSRPIRTSQQPPSDAATVA